MHISDKRGLEYGLKSLMVLLKLPIALARSEKRRWEAQSFSYIVILGFRITWDPVLSTNRPPMIHWTAYTS